MSMPQTQLEARGLLKMITLGVAKLVAIFLPALGFTAGEVIGDKAILGALLGIIGGIIIALLTRGPAMKKEKRDDKNDKQRLGQINSTDQANVFDKAFALQAANHQRDTEYYRRIVSDYKLEARKNEIMRELARESKHNAIAELDNAYAFIRLSLLHCQEKGCEPFRDYVFKTSADLCSHEDEQITKIVSQSIERIGASSGASKLD